MKSEEILIPRKIANQLLHFAQISPETEVCGLIGSRNAHLVSCYPIENKSSTPESRFEMDGKQHIAAMAKLRDRNENLFAIYHSHPSAPAIPSKTDLERATYPEALYLIISLNTKGILEMRGFRINQQTVQEVALCMTEE
jgi:proteasome lid subunit RPN8/RPN11